MPTAESPMMSTYVAVAVVDWVKRGIFYMLSHLLRLKRFFSHDVGLVHDRTWSLCAFPNTKRVSSEE